jgi:hypothetical protein
MYQVSWLLQGAQAAATAAAGCVSDEPCLLSLSSNGFLLHCMWHCTLHLLSSLHGILQQHHLQCAC